MASCLPGGFISAFFGNSISSLSPDGLLTEKYRGTISVTFSGLGLNS